MGRGILRLVEPTNGTVTLDGQCITDMSRSELRAARRHMQMVFQDPYSSLDPSMTIGDSIGEPLKIHDGLRPRERDLRCRAARTGEPVPPPPADQRSGAGRLTCHRAPSAGVTDTGAC